MPKKGAGTVAAHTLEITVRVPEWVPTHADRTESEKFRINRQKILDDGHGYCYGCALAGEHVTDNLQLHHMSEWAEWDAASPEYVANLAKWWDPYGYFKADPTSPIEDPDDLRLLVFLCQPCHTGAPKQPGDKAADPTGYESGGIHYAPFPVWAAERLKRRVAPAHG